MKIFTAVIILTALATPLEAQWLQRPTPGIPRTADGKPNLTAPAPRTADGKPDLTGLWQWLSPDTAVGNVALRKPGDLSPPTFSLGCKHCFSSALRTSAS